MDVKQLQEQILVSWDRHNEILLYLLDNIPEDAMSAVPSGSRGRTVAAQFFHLDRVRRGWTYYHLHGKKPVLDRFDKKKPPSKTKLIELLTGSALDVSGFLKKSFQGESKLRLFGGNIIRWYSYLVSHESHHRGQIMLALKQNGVRLSEEVAINGLWGKWIYGKD